MKSLKKPCQKTKFYPLIAAMVLLPMLLLFLAITYTSQNEKARTEGIEGQQDIEKKVEPVQYNASESEMEGFNILLIGSDRRDEEYGLSDALMVANYLPKTNRVHLVSFMRDTYVDIPNYGMQKINAAHAFGGPELVSETLFKNFGIETNYYVSVDFNAFPKLMDLLLPNGIEVEIPYDMSHGIGMTLEQGVQTLHGDQLLGYVRFRHDIKSDFGRVERQQEVMAALRSQKLNYKSLLNLPEIVETIDTYLDTDIDKRTLFVLAKFLMQEGSSETETLHIPVIDAFTEELKQAGQVLVPDLDANKNALDVFLSDAS